MSEPLKPPIKALGPDFVSYVVGFLFDYDLSEVVLIKKNKPAWQRGLLNGVGGKIEQGETALDAMAREFQEETGLNIAAVDWNHYNTLTGDNYGHSGMWAVHFFYSKVFYDTLKLAQTVEKEEVATFRVIDIPNLPTVPNLKWLIPQALSFAAGNEHTDYFITKEYVMPVAA